MVRDKRIVFIPNEPRGLTLSEIASLAMSAGVRLGKERDRLRMTEE